MATTTPARAPEPAADVGWIGHLHLACAGYPIAFLGAFYGYAVGAALRLGRWPRPWADDPKEVGHALAYYAIGFAGVQCPSAFCLALAGLPLIARRAGRVACARRLALTLGAFAVLVACAALDPGDRFDWWMD